MIDLLDFFGFIDIEREMDEKHQTTSGQVAQSIQGYHEKHVGCIC
jgi:hypothetical protein